MQLIDGDYNSLNKKFQRLYKITTTLFMKQMYPECSTTELTKTDTFMQLTSNLPNGAGKIIKDDITTSGLSQKLLGKFKGEFNPLKEGVKELLEHIIINNENNSLVVGPSTKLTELISNLSYNANEDLGSINTIKELYMKLEDELSYLDSFNESITHYNGRDSKTKNLPLVSGNDLIVIVKGSEIRVTGNAGDDVVSNTYWYSISPKTSRAFIGLLERNAKIPAAIKLVKQAIRNTENRMRLQFQFNPKG